MDHELWSFTNAVAFLIVLILIIMAVFTGLSALFDIQRIKDDWANQRCSPLIMPFSSLFGYDTKQNFEFCMGKIFNMHSASYVDSFGSIFGSFTSLLGSIFNSVSSLRNIIATLGGGINVVFQEFTDRISMFFFKLRTNAIRLKMMFGRVYAILFSVMYMGMSGITGLSSFTNTFLFSFLDTFCFPGDTLIMVKNKNGIGKRPIKEIKIGDILLPGNTRVNATFSFYAKGQPMVQLGSVTVSTNHYVMHNSKAIKAGDHPHAKHIGVWNSDEYLYCLNTSNHIIPVGILDFLDYDETNLGDYQTMQYVEEHINSYPSNKQYLFKEYGFALEENAKIWTKTGLKAIKDIQIGDQLSTGSQVVGFIRKEVSELSNVFGIKITPSTLYWNGTQWIRFGEHFPIEEVTMECISLIVTPNSQIELENGLRIRDYLELCSPDTELYYSKCINDINNESHKLKTTVQ
jgi:hypothetical protein